MKKNENEKTMKEIRWKKMTSWLQSWVILLAVRGRGEAHGKGDQGQGAGDKAIRRFDVSSWHGIATQTHTETNHLADLAKQIIKIVLR